MGRREIIPTLLSVDSISTIPNTWPQRAQRERANKREDNYWTTGTTVASARARARHEKLFVAVVLAVVVSKLLKGHSSSLPSQCAYPAESK